MGAKNLMSKLIIQELNPRERTGIYVGWDSYKVAEKDALWTDGIASCISITLYDPLSKRGALAHISAAYFPEIPKFLYPENVIDTLTRELHPYQGQLEATLAGEAFRLTKWASSLIRKKLQDSKILLVGEDLGNVTIGREVHFDCNTGEVTVYRYQ